MSWRSVSLVVLALVSSGCGGGGDATTAPKPARAHLQSVDGYALDVTIFAMSKRRCVRTAYRYATSMGSTAVCESPQDGPDDRYDHAVYRRRENREALMVDFPDRCAPLRIVGHRSKPAFSCSRTMPGVRITAIPEGRDLQIIDGTYKFDLDLRRPCSEAKATCTIYR